MSLSFQEIAGIVEKRRSDRSPLVQKMLEVQERYNGDYVVPLPNADESSLPPLTPALIFEAIDQTALLASQVRPATYCPALNPAAETGKGSKQWAEIRRKSLNYTWNESYFDTYVAGRAFRHLAGYGTASLVVVPDMDRGYPCIKIRDPLTTFPDPKSADDPTPPENVAFIYGKSPAWIVRNYPIAEQVIKNANMDPGGVWDLVEWIDSEEIVIGLLGPRNDAIFSSIPETRPQYQLELRRWKNKTGMCTAYMPTRVTLDRIASSIANNLGIVDMMSVLLWLDVRATEKSIYPDRYIIGRNGNAPELVGGMWHEGTTGKVNLVYNADQIGEIRGTPDPNNKQTIDRLERNFARSAGLTGPMTGEINGALRSGRTVDQLMSSSTDPRIMELQRIMEVTMTHVNEIILETYKGYWKNKSYSVFSGIPGDDYVDFTPSKHFETNDNIVFYPIPGADLSGTTVALSQMLGAEAISLESYRHQHPLIKDAKHEERQVYIEALRKAEMQGLLNNIMQGNATTLDAGAVIKYLQKGMSLEDAQDQAHKDAQARQAQQAPPPEEGQVAAPETQSGTQVPGAGGEQPPTPPPGAPPVQDPRAQLAALAAAMQKTPSAQAPPPRVGAANG